jgi:hypothetical protein
MLLDDIKVVKLISGEEVLAGIKDIDELCLELLKPVTIHIMGLDNGQKGISISPWVVVSAENAKCIIDKCNILCIMDADQQIAQVYNEKVHGGVSVVKPGLVLPKL